MADAASTDTTIDDLDLLERTQQYELVFDLVEPDDIEVVYAVMPSEAAGKATLESTPSGRYEVMIKHMPLDGGVPMHEVEVFDDLGEAARQLAEWMMLEPDALLDDEDDVDG